MYHGCKVDFAAVLRRLVLLVGNERVYLRRASSPAKFSYETGQRRGLHIDLLNDIGERETTMWQRDDKEHVMGGVLIPPFHVRGSKLVLCAREHDVYI